MIRKSHTAQPKGVESKVGPKLDPSVYRSLNAGDFTLDISASASRQLSLRETQVLRWLALGKSTTLIADILAISVCTVRAHVRSILIKLHASNIHHAIALAFAKGLLHNR